MRKLFLMTVLTMLVSVVSMAQGVEVGLKGGLNFPNSDALGVGGTISAQNLENSTGYHAGPFVKLKVSKIGVQVEALYSFQETSFEQVNTQIPNSTFDVAQRLGYLTVPVMARLYTIAGINFQFGPQFGFLLNAEQEDNILGAKTTTDLKNNLKSSDISLNFGVGIDLPFKLDLHARYILGVSDINDVAGAAKANNSSIQVSLGYSFLAIGR